MICSLLQPLCPEQLYPNSPIDTKREREVCGSVWVWNWRLKPHKPSQAVWLSFVGELLELLHPAAHCQTSNAVAASLPGWASTAKPWDLHTKIRCHVPQHKLNWLHFHCHYFSWCKSFKTSINDHSNRNKGAVFCLCNQSQQGAQKKAEPSTQLARKTDPFSPACLNFHIFSFHTSLHQCCRPTEVNQR